MADAESVRTALLNKIEELAKKTTQADKVRSLAEAFAWVQNPNQPHGGATPGT
jgi:hypothetical protein